MKKKYKKDYESPTTEVIVTVIRDGVMDAISVAADGSGTTTGNLAKKRTVWDDNDDDDIEGGNLLR